MLEHVIETSNAFTEMKTRILNLEKEVIELKQAICRTITPLITDRSKLTIENERLHKENVELKEIKELLTRLNKEQSEAILELRLQIKKLESSSKHWNEIH